MYKFSCTNRFASLSPRLPLGLNDLEELHHVWMPLRLKVENNAIDTCLNVRCTI